MRLVVCSFTALASAAARLLAEGGGGASGIVLDVNTAINVIATALVAAVVWIVKIGVQDFRREVRELKRSSGLKDLRLARIEIIQAMLAKQMGVAIPPPHHQHDADDETED